MHLAILRSISVKSESEVLGLCYNVPVSDSAEKSVSSIAFSSYIAMKIGFYPGAFPGGAVALNDGSFLELLRLN